MIAIKLLSDQNMIKKVFALLTLPLAILFSESIYAEEVDNAVTLEMKQLSVLPIASGSFTQRKYFTVLKHPIKSKGDVFFDVNLGLLWQTNKPLYSALILKNNRVFTQDANNVTKELKGASELSVMLLSIMSGNSTKMLESFTVEANNTDGCMNLIPKLTQLAKVMQNIELCQSKQQANEAVAVNHIDHIVLHEHSGNRTEINLQLTAISALPETIRARLQ